MSLADGRQTSFLLKYLDVDKPRVGINWSIGTTSPPPCSKSCNTLNDHNGKRKQSFEALGSPSTSAENEFMSPKP